MNWQIGYFNEKVEKAVLKMPAGILARYLHLTDLMLEFGPNLGMPHTRALKEKLFELRIKAKEGSGRVFFCTKIERGLLFFIHLLKSLKRHLRKN